MKKKELEEYFKSNKEDWYKTDEKGDKNWDFEKVSEFWQRIRDHKISKGDYDFSDYIFPEFEDLDKEKIEKDLLGINFSINIRETKTIFLKKTNFFNAVFLGNTTFTNYLFEEKVDFSKAVFCEHVDITDCIFNKRVGFNHSIFHEGLGLTYSEFKSKISFSYVEFKEYVVFNNNIFNELYLWGVNFKKTAYLLNLIINNDAVFGQNVFEEEVNFNDILFKKNVDFSGVVSELKVVFHKVVFIGKVNFDYSRIKEKLQILSCSFFNRCTFINTKLRNLNLEDLNKSITKEEYAHFFFTYKENLSDELLEEFRGPFLPPNLIFDSISFDSETLFTRMDLRGVEFYNCDISNIKFSRCDWNIDKKRLVLKNEIKNHRDSEAHYRQLKKNFDSEKNWELSGYSYVSEMEMRKKRLWKEKKYVDWFIYKFYDFFGGYTQDYVRPLFCLFLLLIVSSIIYFFIDYNLLKAIQRGLKGSIPYLQIDIEKPFKGYWLIWKNIQLMLSGTFIAFFILALRKRFKQ
ncbi:MULTISPECIES: pentapeptide repeat-containing protein [unclassified Tenacibaculum]|uniref:pentapeptide repeat-containing protein n=1 Tax=unclassified Tenacibaculum TaxID=2635139 RepID=UPI001F181525|nr:MULTISPECIES: pentapeptide repeat-containing protein [unclassified Tenacibaculum]MCF2873349.1 pentapeptide repeat-containing protein [Tenacibaculum sp. Cn5-1]MCF2933505.1 pentapeptide repeat-containing protein [Tenacibaculum sp. Cn5-34]MCG7509913.1 pentapeptide repeat-containing protein [Tenacibaculum sp. Cn5-46]